jgi:para-aminobenzoate synthetase/4-amino-4-deoxychorismate lyase
VRVKIEAAVQTDDQAWLLFQDPFQIIEARDAEHVTAAIAEVEDQTRRAGCHAVGFVAYEAGQAFGLPTCRRDPRVPLVWFGLFDASNVRRLNHLPLPANIRFVI